MSQKSTVTITFLFRFLKGSSLSIKYRLTLSRQKNSNIGQYRNTSVISENHTHMPTFKSLCYILSDQNDNTLIQSGIIILYTSVVVGSNIYMLMLAFPSG